MQTHLLACHPQHPPLGVTQVEAKIIGRDANWLRARWRVEGSQSLVVPPFAGKGRADELWQTTCFEAFLRPLGGEPYSEWNFAPSGRWASYDFSGYREGMTPAEVDSPPYIRVEDNFTWWALGATIAIPADTNWELGLSAVLEEKDGTKSYWALAHPGEKPDFHDPGCFAARLP